VTDATPPASTPPTGSSSSGLDPNVAAMLSYLAWWVTGILFYIIERDNRFVRFHAAQSIVAFGAIAIAIAGLGMGSFVVLFISTAGFQVMQWLAFVVGTAGMIVWGICLFKAFSGEYFKLPIVGDFAERMAER
jgi:uncharacterized membrane protein